jgi:hypothetical protein
VNAVNLVKETVTVRLDDAPETPKSYRMGEIIVLRSGKGTRDGIDIPPRPERLRTEEPEDGEGAMFEKAPAAEAAPRRVEQRGGERRRDDRPNRGQQQGTRPPRPQRQRNDQTAAAKPQEQQKPRQDTPPKQIVRFASNIPMAGNAAAPAASVPQDGAKRHAHRRGRRRGRGGENGAAGGAPEAPRTEE